jgi:hypothetical protein
MEDEQDISGYEGESEDDGDESGTEMKFTRDNGATVVETYSFP